MLLTREAFLFFAGINKARPSWHNYLTYMPSVTNEAGFISTLI
jgi:hypothetical protein